MNACSNTKKCCFHSSSKMNAFKQKVYSSNFTAKKSNNNNKAQYKQVATQIFSSEDLKSVEKITVKL